MYAQKSEILQFFHMGRSGFGHELLGTDIVKGDLQQGISAHFHDRQDHALAKGGVHDHITLVPNEYYWDGTPKIDELTIRMTNRGRTDAEVEEIMHMKPYEAILFEENKK